MKPDTSTSVDAVITSLEEQYQRLRQKNKRGDTLTPSDLPVIDTTHTLKVSNSEKQKIYEHQEGFQFHGFKKERLSTIFNNFNGSTIWVPHTCQEYFPLKKFEEVLETSGRNASFCHHYDIFLIRKDCDDKKPDDYCSTKERTQNLKSIHVRNDTFPWYHLMLDYKRIAHDFPEERQKTGEREIVDNQLTLLKTPLPPQGLEQLAAIAAWEKRIKTITNYLWAYIAWTHKK